MNLKRANSALSFVGLDVAKAIHNVCALPGYFASYRSLRRTKADSDFAWGKWYPCLDDKLNASGVASGHYFHQDLLVARRIFERNPKRHADFGSRVDGFVAHVATFRPIEAFDIRPIVCADKNIHFRQLDLMKTTDESLFGRYDSISCLHALEHFGLGRYGDKIDYYGHLHGFSSMSKLLASGGLFYLSVPMGPQRIEFNAHRVFSVSYLRKMSQREYTVERFSYVDDAGQLFENVPVDSAAASRNYDCNFGLAIFELRKR